MIWTLKAFFSRDLKIEISYKFNIFFQFISGLFFLLIFYFISKSLIFSDTDLINKYGEDYFIFVSLGIIFVDFIMISLFASSNSIRNGQTFGYLEHIFSYRLDVVKIFIASLAYPFVKNLVRAVLYFVFVSYFFIGNLNLINILDLVLALSLTLIPFIGIGMISMAFIIYFKMGNPINIIASVFSTLFSGIFYPIEVLPNWAINFSNIIPLSYGVEFLRERIIFSTPYNDLMGNMIILIIFSFVFIIIGSFTLRVSYNLSRRKGIVSDY